MDRTPSARAASCGAGIMGTLAFALGALVLPGCSAADPLSSSETPRLQPIAAIAAGNSHSCGVTTSEQAFCWGYGPEGQLGTGSLREVATPQPLAGGQRWRMLSADTYFTCGVTIGNQAYCWGSSAAGRSVVPQRIEGDHEWVSLAAGGSHVCGVTTSRHAYCWGDGEFGELGTGNTRVAATPQPVIGGHRWAMLTAGGTHTCGVSDRGEGYCWGNGGFGQLGTGTSGAVSPQLVLGAHQWAALSAGSYYTCGITTSGHGYCWGDGEYGQLGTGGTYSYGVPQEIVGGHRWTMIAAGYSYTCGITTTEQAYCWGFGGEDNTGRRRTSVFPEITTPQLLAGGHRWSSITVGASGKHACGVTADGQAYCWGYGDDGKLGTGNERDATTPQRVTGDQRWTTRLGLLARAFNTWPVEVMQRRQSALDRDLPSLNGSRRHAGAVSSIIASASSRL
jgi:alpha-tubulin suppressor-like RCC1 family protein